MGKLKTKINNLISWISTKVKSAFDLQDIFVFTGLFLLGYGLWLVKPWLAYSVIGLILFCMGLFVGERSREKK